MKIADILEYLEQNSIEYNYDGDINISFDGFCPLNSLKSNSITWVRHVEDANIEQMNELLSIILFVDLHSKVSGTKFPVIYVDSVHRTFFRVVSHLFKDRDPEIHTAGISRSAVVETSQVGDNLFVGHNSYIGPNVILGNNVTVLHNVTIQGNVRIGDYTTIESGTTIGACGFGHYWDENNNPVAVPHFGGVVIGDHVKIGANNAISRGCLADTIIEDYVKTDNLCHIAHNDHIKRGAMLTANTVISGSTTVGENAWLAPGSLLNNAIKVGDNAFFGIGAVATKDIPAGKVVVGMPAKVLRDRDED